MIIRRAIIVAGFPDELKYLGRRALSVLRWLLWAHDDKKGDGWRPHIDGLRAISVLAVLFYHVGLVNTPGGFVGVDIFFVISGFLISKVIYADIAFHGKFRIVRFYERRARRILPAFCVVTAGAILAGYFLFLPDDFANLGSSAIYASGFAANIFFYHTSGYFTGQAITKPLLHYWSLGVEEQFYIIFPLVILLVFKIAPRLLGVAVISIAIASLALAQRYLETDASAAFYLTPPRAWELMAGCLLALPNFPYSGWRALCEVASAVGLGLILFAALTYNYATPFPGASAAVPVAGAALILWSCERSSTVVGLLLSIKPLRYIGLWSYSIYMVHWPLIVFARVYWPYGGRHFDIDIVAVSIGLGWLSYLLVESPFRSPAKLLSAQILFQTSLVSLALLATFGFAISSSDGFPKRLPEAALKLLAYNHYDYAPIYRQNICFIAGAQSWDNLNAGCLPKAKPSTLLWGDSFAAHYYEALKERFPHIAVAQANMSSCPPILGFERFDIPSCKQFNELVLKWALADKPDSVILSASWPLDASAISGLEATVRALHSASLPVIIVGQTPIYVDTVPNILTRRLLRGDRDTLAHRDGIGSSIWGDYYMKKRFSSMSGVRYLSSEDLFCKAPDCPLTTKTGFPIHWDTGHLTLDGATLVVKRMFRDGLPVDATH